MQEAWLKPVNYQGLDLTPRHAGLETFATDVRHGTGAIGNREMVGKTRNDPIAAGKVFCFVNSAKAPVLFTINPSKMVDVRVPTIFECFAHTLKIGIAKV